MRACSAVFLALLASLPLSCGSASSSDPPPAPTPEAGTEASVPDASPEAAGGAAGSGGQAGNPGCQFNTANQACNECLRTTCGDSCAACSKDPDCGALYTCMRACSTYDCQQECEAKHLESVPALMSFLGKGGCVHESCAGTCDLGFGGSGPDPFAAARETCFQKTNELRAQAGAPALQHDLTMEPCADQQAKNDGNANSSYGNIPYCTQASQNECAALAGTPESAVAPCLQELFDQGPGTIHHDQMIDPARTRVSCGFFVTTEGKVWVVQNLY